MLSRQATRWRKSRDVSCRLLDARLRRSDARRVERAVHGVRLAHTAEHRFSEGGNRRRAACPKRQQRARVDHEHESLGRLRRRGSADFARGYDGHDATSDATRDAGPADCSGSGVADAQHHVVQQRRAGSGDRELSAAHRGSRSRVTERRDRASGRTKACINGSLPFSSSPARCSRSSPSDATAQGGIAAIRFDSSGPPRWPVPTSLRPGRSPTVGATRASRLARPSRDS